MISVPRDWNALITIFLNGEIREAPENLTLQGLLEWLNMPLDRVAVEVNREIARRTRWAETPIREGDRLEIVHFVGGGAGLHKLKSRR